MNVLPAQIQYVQISNEILDVKIINLLTNDQIKDLDENINLDDLFLNDKETSQGIFCKIANSVNPKVSLDLSKLSFVIYLNNVLLTENIEYRFAYSTDENDNKYIDVIYYNVDQSNAKGIDWTQGDVKIYINYEATLFSNVVTDENVSEFMQTSSLIYEVPVSKPFYKSNSSITYIEDSLYNINNDKENYTYISKVLTNTGYNLYGVKRKEWRIRNGAFTFGNIDYLNIKEKPNINAEVVKLTPNTSQLQIYSFKNGPQYMELSNDALNRGLMNDGKLLPHYLQSYEYKIDGTIPSNNNDYNIKFYGSNGYVSSGNLSVPMCSVSEMFTQLHSTITAEEEIDTLNGFLAYSFTVPYVYSADEEISYAKIRNQHGITKRNSANVYENTYVALNSYYSNVSQSVLQSYSDVLEVYERKTTYVKLDNSLFSLSDINNGKYYKYDPKSSTYTVLSNVENISGLEVYAKCISYTKISSNIKTNVVGNEFYDDTNVKKYMQLYEYSYINVNDRENAIKSLFYVSKEIAPNSYAYYPLQAGIVNDGSIEYYGFTYVKLSEDKISEYKGEGESDHPKLYIKQDYTPVSINDLTNLSESDLNNLYVSEGDIVYKELLSNSDTIFDININDNIIYAKKDGDNIVPMNRSEFENIYYNSNQWFLENKQKEKSTNKLDNYSLPTNFNIVAKVNYDGKWNKLDIKKLSNRSETLSEYATKNKLFIKKESYNKISSNDLVVGYDVDFYVWGIGKIDALSITDVTNIYIDVTKYINDTTDLIHPNYANGSDEVIYDEDTWLDSIDIYGFGKHLKYFTRKPVMSDSDDVCFFVDKEYYTLQTNSNKINGVTPLMPIAYLGVKNNSTIYSLMNYWNRLGNETPLYTAYVRLRNETAKLLVNSGCEQIIYTENGSTEKHDVVNPSPSTKVSNQSTYYLKLNTYSGNNYIEINNVLDNEYDYCLHISQYDSYEFNWDQLRFYKDAVSHYLISEENNLVTDIVDYDKKYIYSKFFYQEFTNNNGVHQAKDGSYYTTISIFDGTRGTISKSLFLQPNVFNVTEYTYNYTTYAFIEVDFDEDLSNVPQSEYSKYFYKDENNKYVQLTSESKSPAYYQAYLASFDQQLYTYMTKEMVALYDGRNVGPLNNLQVQYFDNLTYEPKIIKKNDDLFGIIFNIDLTNTIEPQTILCTQNNMFLSPIENDFSFPYEYDIVRLKEYIIHNDNLDDFPIVLQSQKTEYKNITAPAPFYLANEKKAEFTGSYVWNLPKHSYVFAKQKDNYVAYDIIKEDGYWERKYEINSIPLVIASYNFYTDPTKISNTTLSYTFTPDSKIITEVIEHPEITYKSIVKESREVARYKYIYQGIEHDYPSTSYVQENDDGTYYGIIDIDGKNKLVNLTKYIDIDFVNVLKDIVHQEHSITYEYSTYKTSIALTNEKTPVLYNTELIPATSHKILYWNEDAESYAIKTVVDSYAHYAYNYYYDVVPFVTTTYMRQDSDITISYISDISDALGNLSNSISVSMSEVSQSVSGMPSVLNELKDAITVFGNQNSEKLGYLESLSNNITEALNNLQTATVSDDDGTSTININEITQSIDNQSNALSGYISALEPKLFNINKTINDSIESLKNDLDESLHNMFEYESESITYVLKEGFRSKRLPTYEEFMVELTKNMYAKIDFDKEIVDTEQKDENGNMVTKSKHKPNPTDLAQKTIYRADILWKELKKKNIVN